jgi:hypothetical protein
MYLSIPFVKTIRGSVYATVLRLILACTQESSFMFSVFLLSIVRVLSVAQISVSSGQFAFALLVLFGCAEHDCRDIIFKWTISDGFVGRLERL